MAVVHGSINVYTNPDSWPQSYPWQFVTPQSMVLLNAPVETQGVSKAHVHVHMNFLQHVRDWPAKGLQSVVAGGSKALGLVKGQPRLGTPKN